MRVLIATLILFLGVPQTVPQSSTGAIEGKVVRVSNSEPISGVEVVLAPPLTNAPAAAVPPDVQQRIDNLIQQGQQVGAPQVQIDNAVLNIRRAAGLAPPTTTVLTDADGKFAFRNLAPGAYGVRVQRNGYFGPQAPNGTYPGVVNQFINVDAQRTAKVDFGMVQGGVLRGLLRDPDGQPAANYAVVTARPGYSNAGRVIWLLTGAMNADDRGEYRWPGFPPGEYYVGAGPRAPGPIANVQDSWARVFYPGVIDPNLARPVTIPEGGEVTINLSAQVKPWGSFKISGVAINPLPNLPADPATGVVSRAVTGLVLMPYDLTPLDNPPVTMWTNLVATNTRANGEFVLTNVDPGRYELYAMANDAQSRRVWTGHMRVEVKDKDITGLNIAVSPGVTIQGQVAITGSATVRPETIRVALQSLGTLPPQVGMAIGTVSVDESGRFQIANLAEGRYRMAVQVPPGAYVASIQHGGANVFDDGFEVDARSSQLPIRVEINTAGGTVEGNVRASSLDVAPSAAVVLVPVGARRNNPAYYKTAATDAKGHFTIRGVAPGAYTIFAWESVMPGAYQNAEFLEKYQSRGRPLTVQPGGGTEIQLDLIRN